MRIDLRTKADSLLKSARKEAEQTAGKVRKEAEQALHDAHETVSSMCAGFYTCKMWNVSAFADYPSFGDYTPDLVCSHCGAMSSSAMEKRYCRSCGARIVYEQEPSRD